MNADINLLPQRKGNVLQSEQTLLRVRVFATLCVVGVIISGVVAFFINQTNSPTVLKTQQDTLTATVNASKTKAIAQLQLIDRLNHIQTIITNRSSMEKNIQLIRKQLPDSVTITQFSLDEKELSFGISAGDLTVIDQVTSHMADVLKSKKLIKKMTIENIVADQKTGKYTLMIDGTL